ncbi:MAG: DUF1684 domain-containing protein [Bacteroidetes bacterium]|nr:DUF1684 domain-containing protein [Bacteroidota bacterium]
MRPALLLIALSFLLITCQQEKSTDDGSYKKEIEAWHQERVNNLKAPNGWLNLAGLYWLKSGANSFGSGKENDLIFPENKIAGNAGVFLLQNGQVSVLPAKGVQFYEDGNPFNGGKIFPPDSGNAMYLTHQSLRFTVIKRNERLGIRLRDDSMLEDVNLSGLVRFPVNKNYEVEGILISGTENDSIDIANVLGQQTRQKSGGRFAFELLGEEFELTTIDEGGAELFIVFGDKTTGKETYGGGRFLYVPKPDQDGKTIIDFNRAINPPCVFTEFATCPLPPAYNKLGRAVEAGEKDYHHQPNQ